MVLPAPADAEAHSDLPENGQGEEGPSRPRRPPEFYSSVFAQIEEVGWERLVSAAGDDGVSCLTFRVMDEHGRDHLLEITFTLPAHELSCMSSFHCRGCSLSPKITVVKKLKTERCSLPIPRAPEDIARLLDDIDKVLWVVDPTKPSYAMSHRRIALGDDCYILLHVDAHKPSSLPECRFLGTDGKLDRLVMNWRKKSQKLHPVQPRGVPGGELRQGEEVRAHHAAHAGQGGQGLHRQHHLPALSLVPIEISLSSVPALVAHCKWLEAKKLHRIVLVIMSKVTSEVLERWNFNIKTDAEVVKKGVIKEKSDKEIMREIQTIMRQVASCITYLPCLDETYILDMLAYTDKDVAATITWVESDAKLINNL